MSDAPLHSLPRIPDLRYHRHRAVSRDEIIQHLRERIVAYAASRISRDVAEDLAQEVLMLLHDKYPHVASVEELLPLSMQIMRFKLVSVRRKAYRRGEPGQISVDEVPLPDSRNNPEMEAQRRELLTKMSAAVQQLGDRCREIFRLKLLGRTFPEIQAAMKADSINTVYTWDSRCRKQLQELMGAKGDKSK